MAARPEWTMAITPAQVLSAKFHPDGSHLFLAGSEDTHFMSITTDKPMANYSAGPTVDVHSEGVYDLCLNKSGDKIMTCSSDHQIKITSYPDTSKSSMHTRFDVAATCCAFSSCENLVASGAQDGAVKVTPLVGEAATRKWKAHNGCVKGLAFDPQRKYLVSTGEDGMVCIWDYTTNAPGEHKVWSSDLLPHSDMKLSQLNRAVWDSTGAKLAIPTYTGIVIVERESWKELKRLQDHKAEVLALDWSPNGHYMISAHNDNSVVVWDLSPSARGGAGESLDRIKHQRKVIAVAWHPKRNSVALIDEDGKFTIWENVVLATGGRKKDPVKDAAPRPLDEYEKKKQSVSSLFNDSETPASDASAQGSAAAAQSTQAAEEEEEDLIGNVDRKAAMDRLVAIRSQSEQTEKRRDGSTGDLVDPDDTTAAAGGASKPDDAMDVDAGTAAPTANATAPVKPRQAAAAARRRPNPAMGGRPYPSDWAPVVKLQAPFQPNASPYTEKRRYLCWNDVGLIVCRYDEAGSSYLEVEFSDQGRYRNFTATKSVRVRHGALGMRGIALASEGEVGIAGSVLIYQSFDSLGMNADWQRDLGSGEVAEALAIGTGFIAVATSNLSVRIFSEAGMQKFAMTMPSPVVALVARGSYLAAFYHLGAPFGGTQNMGFSLWNVHKEAELFSERKCPLSLNSSLAWAGFSSDESILTTLDSTGIFRQIAGYDQAPIGAGASGRAAVFGSTAPATLTSLKSDSPNWSGSWCVVLDSTRHKLMSQQKFWPVSLTKEKLRWVPCVTIVPPSSSADGSSTTPIAPSSASEPAYAPQVLPRPVASSASFEAALLNVDQTVGAFEETHLRHKIAYNHLKHRVIQESEDQNGVDTEDSWRENREVVAAQVELDKSILRIIQASCEAERVDRALDCVNELFLRKSIGVAVQIATKTEQIQLAQTINQILRREVAASERQKNRAVGLPSASSYGGSYTQMASYSARESAESEDESTHPVPPPAKRAKVSAASSAPTRGRATAMYVSDDENDNTQAITDGPQDDAAGEEDDGILNQSISRRKSASSEAMDVDNDDQASGGAPVNPFSKATKSAGPGAGSIFDTIKSMKTAPAPAAPAAAEAKGRGKKAKAASAAPKAKQQTLVPSSAGQEGDKDADGADGEKTDANKKKRKLFS